MIPLKSFYAIFVPIILIFAGYGCEEQKSLQPIAVVRKKPEASPVPTANPLPQVTEAELTTSGTIKSPTIAASPYPLPQESSASPMKKEFSTQQKLDIPYLTSLLHSSNRLSPEKIGFHVMQLRNLQRKASVEPLRKLAIRFEQTIHALLLELKLKDASFAAYVEDNRAALWQSLIAKLN